MIVLIDELFRSSIVGRVESGLSLKYEDLMAWVAERALKGYRANEAEGLTVQDETEIDLYVQEGYREFLLSYDWSFLTPGTTATLWATTDGTATLTASGEGYKTVTASSSTFFPSMVGHTIESTNGSYVIDGYVSSTIVTVTTSAEADDGEAFTITSDGSYRLPDDFSGLVGDVFCMSSDSRWHSLTNTGVAEMWQSLRTTTSTGRPTRCAVYSRPMEAAAVGAIGQRFDLLVWQFPSQDYYIAYEYRVIPPKLITGGYPYGGGMHAEALKCACVAAMERTKFGLVDGPMERQWQKMLALSIKVDKRSTRASTVGFVANRGSRGYSDGFYPRARGVTCEGVSYP